MGKTTYRMIGASNHSKELREIHDFYATPPEAVEELLKHETFDKNIWEPACGMGHISDVLIKNGYNVISSDLIDRGYGIGGIDFLFHHRDGLFDGDTITNPPYRLAQDFVERALQVIEPGHKVAMLLRLSFLEGKARRDFFKRFPPVRVYVSSSRIQCAKNGDFQALKNAGGSAIAFAWFIWIRGHSSGSTELKWFN